MRAVLRVLAIEVTHRGFSFAVLEGSERLIECGNRSAPRDTSVFLAKLTATVDRYRPDVLALEEPAGSKKGRVVRDHLAWAEQFAVDRSLRVVALPCREGNKDRRAAEMARLFPELAPHLPKPRKLWQSEARGTAKFIAAERGLEALKHLERRDLSTS